MKLTKINYFLFFMSFLLMLMSCSSKKNLSKSTENKKEMIEGKSMTENQRLNFETYFFSAQKHQALDDVNEAIDDYQKAISINPIDGASYFEMSKLYLKQGNFFKGLEYSEKAANLNPTNKWYILQKANLLKRNAMYKEAAIEYQRYVDLDKNNFEVLIELADLYSFNQDYEKAAKTYAEILKITGPNDEVILQIQRLYVQAGKVDKAIEEMKLLIEQDPNNPTYYGMLGQLYADMGEKEKSVAQYYKALEIAPNDGRVLTSLALYHSEKGDEIKAIEFLKKAFKTDELSALMKFQILNDYYEQSNYDTSYKKDLYDLMDIMEAKHPKDAKSYVIYGDYLVRDNRLDLAREKFRTAAKLDEGNFAIWSQLIVLDLQQNDYSALEQDAKNARELFPAQPIFYLYNGIALSKQKQYKKANTVFFEGKELVIDNNELLFDFYQNIGDAYYELNEYSNSDKYYDKALELSPNSAFLLNNYAYYLSLRNENLDKAASMSKRSNDLIPNQASFLDTYGWILFMQNKFVEAEKWLKKALENQGDESGVILEHYGDVQIQLGNESKAIEYWEKAKKMGDTSEKLEEKIIQKKYID